MIAARADTGRVDEPDELLATSRALARHVVMVTAFDDTSQPQLSHLSLDLTRDTTYTTHWH